MEEEQVCELGNVVRHKRGLADWKGGRERGGLVSPETWHITDEDSLARGEEEERVGELGNMARQRTH
jgi:hypothetical protein